MYTEYLAPPLLGIARFMLMIKVSGLFGRCCLWRKPLSALPPRFDVARTHLQRGFASSQALCFETESLTVSPTRFKVKKILSIGTSNDATPATPTSGTGGGIGIDIGSKVKVQGWVRTMREQKTFAFIAVNDGSCLKDLQVVAEADISTYDVLKTLSTGAAVEVIGTLVASAGNGQHIEIQADSLKLVGECPADTYPLQKKRHSQEFLRTIAHLRPRTNTIAAVARVRSALAQATHQYFEQEGFVYLHTPLITASDCEGAGDMFRVTTLPIDTPSRIPLLDKDKTDVGTETIDTQAIMDGNTNFRADFFGKPTFLTVSGQLSGETYACALGDIYTFGPTFRSENSHTARHLAEFHMIEPEMAFADLHSAMDNAESFVKYVVKHALTTCAEDLIFFEKYQDKTATLVTRLQQVVQQPFVRVSYRDAIALLSKEISKNKKKWQFPDVHFGTDLATEHERWLAEIHFKSCVFVHDYPRSIKSFYMRDNDDDKGEITCASFDLLVPGVGELIGGSQREERLEVLQKKMADFHLEEKDYSWYLDLRRYGSVPHSGYGLGFERLVCYVTAMDNIREAIAFPRYPGSAEF